jgi:hypothetical protein
MPFSPSLGALAVAGAWKIAAIDVRRHSLFVAGSKNVSIMW